MGKIIWTDYLRHRANQRGFDLDELERVLRFAEERYSDTATGRHVVVGRHHGRLVMIPFETEHEVIKPVTVHATTRQQINFRVKTERFKYE